MAFPIRGQSRSRAVAAGPPSVSRLFDVRANFADVASTLATRSDFSCYIGKHSTEPVVFTDLTGPSLVDGSQEFLTLTYTLTDTATVYNFADGASLSTFSIGDHLWLCIFDGQSASGSDPVIAVQDLGLAVA